MLSSPSLVSSLMSYRLGGIVIDILTIQEVLSSSTYFTVLSLHWWGASSTHAPLKRLTHFKVIMVESDRFQNPAFYANHGRSAHTLSKLSKPSNEMCLYGPMEFLPSTLVRIVALSASRLIWTRRVRVKSARMVPHNCVDPLSLDKPAQLTWTYAFHSSTVTVEPCGNVVPVHNETVPLITDSNELLQPGDYSMFSTGRHSFP